MHTLLDLFDRFEPAKRRWAAFWTFVVYITQKDIIDHVYGLFHGGDLPPKLLEDKWIAVICNIELFIFAILIMSLIWPLISWARSSLFGKAKYGKQLIGEMGGTFLSHEKEIYVVGQGHRISTVERFSPPVAFELIAKTNSTDLRIAYAVTRQIIFRWYCDNSLLRIDGGPLDRKHALDVGDIPVDTWVKIELIVKKRSLTILVDDSQIYSRRADFLEIYMPFSVLQDHDAKISVKSLRKGKPI